MAADMVDGLLLIDYIRSHVLRGSIIIIVRIPVYVTAMWHSIVGLWHVRMYALMIRADGILVIYTYRL